MTGQLLNPTHIIFLLVIVLLVLGPKKLPATGRALGRSMREFRDGVTGRDNPPLEAETQTAPAVAPAPPPAALAAPAPELPTAAGQSAAVTVPETAAPQVNQERTAA